MVDSTKWNNQDVPKDQWGNEQFNRIELHTNIPFPAVAKTGRLRLVRVGSTLHFYASDEPDKDFNLLHMSDFGTGDLKNVRVLAATGGPGALLDVRITDLHIRAEGFPKEAAVAVVSEPEPTGARRWMTLLALSVLSLAVVVFLGVWLSTRRRRPAGPAKPVPGTGAANAIGFACTSCNKRLKARAEQAGRKLKCPHCG